MVLKMFVLLLFVVFGTSAAAPSVGSHFTKCSLKDPQLESCLLAQAKAIWPHLLPGVRKWNIPPLEPIRVEKLTLSESGNQAVNVMMSGSNCTFKGYKDLEIESVKADAKNLHFEFTVNIPKLSGEGQYEMKGKLLVFPIQGQGDFNFYHLGEHFVISFDFKKVEKDGKKFLKLEETHFKYLGVKEVGFYFDNLFGNKQLSDDMNKVLSENAMAVFGDLKVRIEDTFSQLFHHIFTPMFTTVDITQLFNDVD